MSAESNREARGVWALYRQSLKPSDSLFNLYLARPLAAPLVYLLAKTRITPNQVTFASLAVMIGAVSCLIGVNGSLGVILAVIGVELSYVLDCVDGQLARVTQRSSVLGGDLDFMMDELKAYLLIAGIGARGALSRSGLIEAEPHEAWRGLPDGAMWPLIVSLGALLVTASAITLTRFIRSERYAEATGSAPQAHGQSAGEGKSGGALWPLKSAIRLITQYPASLPIFALFSALDIFLYAYGVLHLLYAGQAGLGVALKLGRFAPQNKLQRSTEDEEN